MAETSDTIPGEVWRDIPGFDGRYQASSLGRIKSLPRKVRMGCGWRVTRERLMKFSWHKGYAKIHLRHPDGGHRHCWVHRLVCQTFHPKPDRDVIVAHNDGNSENNKSENLRWASPLENALDKHSHGTLIRGEQIAGAKLTRADVKQIRKATSQLITEMAQAFGVNRYTVADVVYRRTWTHVRH